MEDPHQRFLRVEEPRLARIVQEINKLGKPLQQSRTIYECTADDRHEMVETLLNAIADFDRRFERRLGKQSA